MTKIIRKKEMEVVGKLLELFPVVALLGPRQCGKTTLAGMIAHDHYFDLENPRDLARLAQPQLALEDLKGRIFIDEIQRLPDLFPLLRHLVDHHSDKTYLVLGSASRDLIRQSSESLAGRIAYVQMGGFRLDDVGHEQWKTLWLRGGLPPSTLAPTEESGVIWRENYVTTFLERDIPQLGISIPPPTLRRFWIMLSHYHGQIVNYTELGKSFGISDVTARKYCEILEATFMVRLLQPWHSNLKKRMVKRPKLYLRDSGLFHTLQSIESWEQISSHPKLGASWEGFSLECVLRILGKEDHAVFFWRTHNGAELDLFWQQGGKNWGVELKYLDAPRMTKSMHSAIKDLDLAGLWVVHPGSGSYRLDPKVNAISLRELPADWPYEEFR